MSQFEIKSEKSIPYFDHEKSLLKTIKNSGKRRGMNPFYFAFRKFKNYFLFWAAYFCPLNGWRVRFNKWRGVNIGGNVYIGMQCSIDNAYPEYIYIEDSVSLAGNVTILAHSNPYKHFSNVIESKVAPVVIKKGAWIGVNVVILSNVTIGEYAIVSVGSVVIKNVKSYSLVGGNPCKKITDLVL